MDNLAVARGRARNLKEEVGSSVKTGVSVGLAVGTSKSLITMYQSHTSNMYVPICKV